MDILEIRKLKKQTEEQIKNLLEKFGESTGVKVVNVNYKYSREHGREEFCNCKVILETEI